MRARLGWAFGVLMLLLAAGACTSEVDPVHCDECDGTQDGASEPTLSPFPDEATLCEITYNESSSSDVFTVLGEPDHVDDSGNGSLNYFYEYRAGARLFIGFQADLFVDAHVAEARYPTCWSEQERALIDAPAELPES